VYDTQVLLVVVVHTVQYHITTSSITNSESFGMCVIHYCDDLTHLCPMYGMIGTWWW
jgi:hypothetical protein